MAPKPDSYPGSRRGTRVKPPADQPERFRAEELHRGRREDRTQKKFVPLAMRLSLAGDSGMKPPAQALPRKGGGRVPRRSPSTYRLDKSNVKRKPGSR